MRSIKGLKCVIAATIILATIGLYGCSKPDDASPSSSGVAGDSSASVSASESNKTQITPGLVEDESLGIRLSLTDGLSDCVCSKLSDKECEVLLEGSLGGVSIIKNVSGENHVISNILVVENSLIEKPEVHSRFPYIQTGEKYSLVATIQHLYGVDNSEASKIKANLMQQFMNTEFNEEILKSIESEEELN